MIKGGKRVWQIASLIVDALDVISGRIAMADWVPNGLANQALLKGFVAPPKKRRRQQPTTLNE